MYDVVSLSDLVANLVLKGIPSVNFFRRTRILLSRWIDLEDYYRLVAVNYIPQHHLFRIMPFAAMAVIPHSRPIKEPALPNTTPRRRRRIVLLILEFGMIYSRHRSHDSTLGSSPLWMGCPLLRMHWAQSPMNLP